MNKFNESNNRAPVILFTYNRIHVLKKTVETLRNNLQIDETDLFIFSDGPKTDKDVDKLKVYEVREYLKSLTQFTKTITYYEHETNLGLSRSLIFGISKVSKNYKNFIVLEDDLIISPYFLKYMNNSLDRYKDSQKVWAVNGMGINKDLLTLPDSYQYSTYFTYRPSSHGWGSWSHKWQEGIWENKKIKQDIFKYKNLLQLNRGGMDLFEMLIQQLNGKIDSWAIKWCFTISKNNGLCLSPTNSYVTAQPDKQGTHIKGYVKVLDNDLSKSLEIITYPKSTNINDEIVKKLSVIYSQRTSSSLENDFSIFNKIFEYLIFLKRYFTDRYSIKSKKHKIYGFIKTILGKS